jgi:formate/nitrite transporter FocA (FNT family)
MSEPGNRNEPFKTHATIFDQQVRWAVDELKQPDHSHVTLGILAGIGVGFGALMVGVGVSLVPEAYPELVTRFLVAGAYAIGFVLVIMGRTLLFTEYTTIALLPALTGAARPGALLRFWALVYVANLVGGGLIALAIAKMGPGLGVIDIDRMAAFAHALIDPAAPFILLSAVLAGWLMGVLSWLVVVVREGIAQMVLIAIVGGTIGFAHLHHAITGTIEVSVAVWFGRVPFDSLVSFVLWTTVGNVIGGVLFAVSIRYSVWRAGSTSDMAAGEGQ